MLLKPYEYPIAHANALDILVHLKGYTIHTDAWHCPVQHICQCLGHSSVGAPMRTHNISRHYNNVWRCTAHAIALGIPESSTSLQGHREGAESDETPIIWYTTAYRRDSEIISSDGSYCPWDKWCTEIAGSNVNCNASDHWRYTVLFPSPTRFEMSERNLLLHEFGYNLYYKCLMQLAVCPQSQLLGILQSLWWFVKFFAKYPLLMCLNFWRPYTSFIFPIQPCTSDGLHLFWKCQVVLEVQGPHYVPTGGPVTGSL